MEKYKIRILNVLKGQLMYLEDDTLSSINDKLELKKLIIILINELSNYQISNIKIDANILNKNLIEQINNAKSKNIIKIYNILKGQLMIITDSSNYSKEEKNLQLQVINALKLKIDTLERPKKLYIKK